MVSRLPAAALLLLLGASGCGLPPLAPAIVTAIGIGVSTATIADQGSAAAVNIEKLAADQAPVAAAVKREVAQHVTAALRKFRRDHRRVHLPVPDLAALDLSRLAPDDLPPPAAAPEPPAAAAAEPSPVETGPAVAPAVPAPMSIIAPAASPEDHLTPLRAMLILLAAAVVLLAAFATWFWGRRP